MSEPPVLLSKWYEYTKWVISRVDQFPKNQRFILGQRLVDVVLDIHECLIEGAYSRGAKKRDQLTTANRKIEVLRWLIRLAHERELVSARQFAFSCEQLSECGGCSAAGSGRPGERMKRHKQLFEQVCSFYLLFSIGTAR